MQDSRIPIIFISDFEKVLWKKPKLNNPKTDIQENIGIIKMKSKTIQNKNEQYFTWKALWGISAKTRLTVYRLPRVIVRLLLFILS